MSWLNVNVAAAVQDIAMVFVLCCLNAMLQYVVNYQLLIKFLSVYWLSSEILVHQLEFSV